MTLALRYAVRSDVGLLREGNEDSAYAGPHLLAVADGMGGHAAGEVASAADHHHDRPARRRAGPRSLTWSARCADAVATANHAAAGADRRRPGDRGHGHDADRAAVVGRATPRSATSATRAPTCCANGQFLQITHDHTLVQSLVDEGKITEDDVPPHPHRSLLLRALDGRTIAEPDLTRSRRYPGDRYLLCSDGLSRRGDRADAAPRRSARSGPGQGGAAARRARHQGRRSRQHHLHRGRRHRHARRAAVPPTWTPGAGRRALNRRPG